MDARDLSAIASDSVALVVTSPPYPMIEMWDEVFAGLDPSITAALASAEGGEAFEKMHRVLDDVFAECRRVLIPGGICCINIGDATRSLAGRFKLYPSGARIVSGCRRIGFDVLPRVIWRKSTNAPNKFMGSGMLPGGAYVTLEHEHVLVFRNGAKREFFGQEAKSRRYRSAYFFEERNRWFSDVWTDLLGTRQTTGRAELRERSAAYPLELAYRVVHMYSIQGDTVLDPFVGTGTTALAALAGARNSVGVDIDEGFVAHAARRCAEEWPALNGVAEKRLLDHRRFIDDYRGRKKEPKHWNENHRIAVITRQETELELPMIETVSPTAEGVSATYRRFPDPTGPLFAGDPM